MKDLPIGVFDSGIGGLTVLYKLIELFPHEDFVYIGDTKNLPYGTKDKDTLKGLVTDVATYLKDYKVKGIVIACNTATTQSYHLNFDIPVVGVIAPTAEYALNISENILLLATNVTIDSNAYQDIFKKLSKNNQNQYFVKASAFVDAIESKEIDTPYSHKLVYDVCKDYLDKKIDVIVCGCTHFGLYEKEFKSLFKDAQIVECALPTALELKRQLEAKNLLKTSGCGKVYINLTKKEEGFEEKIKWFDKKYEYIREIKIK